MDILKRLSEYNPPDMLYDEMIKEIAIDIQDAKNEIEQLRETVSMLAGDRDLYMEEIKQKNAEIERLRKFIKEHDMAEVLEDWENA